MTHGQPFSPVAVVIDESGNLWQVGEVASVDLERMAEGGDNASLLALPQAQAPALKSLCKTLLMLS